jgi:NADH-quinone oxidoreductase subunit G
MTEVKIKVRVNGTEHEVTKGLTVLQACETAGVEVPCFCYHPKLSIAGNCRMCLVEVKGGPPKPVASCAMPAGDGMEIQTNTDMVKKARKGALEFLLINHPLDCPICDQGGECDLQDLTMAYGPSTSRFEENKRAVHDKYFGPLVKTMMTRCIHCTRCVRFASEIAGVGEIGAFGRGEHMEISTYLEGAITSELSGNLIDICPVGALTAKPYAFEGRAWEFQHTSTIDVMDAVGSHIRVDTRGEKIMRIVPRAHDDINEEWISDKTRFACDGLSLQRLDRPYIRTEKTHRPASWAEAFEAAQAKIKTVKPEEIAAIAGDLADVETLFVLKTLMAQLGSSHVDCRRAPEFLPVEARGDYLFNTTIRGIEKADALLLVGTNPRHEATTLNARIRKAYLAGTLRYIGFVGCASPDLTYPYSHMGTDLSGIKTAHGKDFFEVFKKAERPMIIIGQSVLRDTNAAALLGHLRSLAKEAGCLKDDWNGYNILHEEAARVGALDVGFYPKNPHKESVIKMLEEGKIKVLYNYGVDDLPDTLLKNVFVIYQGHHGDRGARQAHVIFPGAAYTEKTATYTNTEGRMQRTLPALFPLGLAKEDWDVVVHFAKHLDITLPYETLEDIRSALSTVHEAYQQEGTVHASPLSPIKKTTGEALAFEQIPPVAPYYMSNVIARHSPTMAACVREKEIVPTQKRRTGTNA